MNLALRKFFAILLCIFCVAAVLCPSFDKPQGNHNGLTSPSLSKWLGTDHLGRDVLALAVQATRSTLYTAGVAAIVACLGGIFVSLAGKRVSSELLSSIISPLADMMGPLIPAAAILCLYPKIPPIALAVFVGILAWPTVSRPLSALLFRLRAAPYVEASILLGSGTLSRIRLHMLPEVTALMSPLFFTISGNFIALFTCLEFLGASVQSASGVGLLMYDGLNHLRDVPWLMAAAVLSYIAAFIVLFSIKKLVATLIRDPLSAI